MLVTQFEDDEEEPAAEKSDAAKSAPEYVFEGFDIEFSEKIALTPLTPRRRPVTRSA